MFSNFTKAGSCRMLAFGSLLLLAACGGGGSSTADPAPAPAPAPDPKPNPQPTPTPPALTLAATYTDVTEGSTIGTVNPDWKNGSGDGQEIDGVKCATVENYHIHMIVSIYKDGVRQALPSHIGLSGCTYELHTHDSSGIVHLEADSQRSYTLGQFFAVWGQQLSNTGVAGISGQAWFYTIDNEKVTAFTGDPSTIPLVAHREIAIVIGTPPAALDKDRLAAGL